jgi:hypothetical protein
VLEQRHVTERLDRLVPSRLSLVRAWIEHYDRFWYDHLERLQKQLSKVAKND